MRFGARIGVDVGSVRIGVARSDPSGMLATPVETVRRGKGDLARIAAIVAEHEAIEVVVGWSGPPRLASTSCRHSRPLASRACSTAGNWCGKISVARSSGTTSTLAMSSRRSGSLASSSVKSPR
ncbi:Holliday junction resolvase RuvX, partial [Nonomuraea fuscirosea]